ncbi:uncharacterized protein YgbK (DUF1537 family) [Sphingomonas jinjuensis]|uniref:Uncharacterized protein YgbK (DUF1537 family) n=1 Tax=Sphingomonas jinjuensis TaxID=535907 RepID=A0A840EYY9_9SPHN|nr:uncharacterized protein YgbK (DUF1537 family) [Sphingomonas jinjuensis]
MTPLYAYYGDDFTGSTDVLEQLAEGGVPAVLFLRAPDERLRARFPDARAIGLAGDARSRTPAWMDAELPALLTALNPAGIVHYKTCSTFDSSPVVGSIGRALDIGLAQLGGPAAIVVGAPHLRRYVAFATLFAAGGSAVHRIDRHPTMAHHPVTPMHEADLIRHLAAQTDATIGHVSLEALHAGRADEAFDAASANDAVLFDGMTTEDLAITGQILVGRAIRFAVGSSGVTRALVLAWRAAGLIGATPTKVRAEPVDRLLVVSGSCSPVTARQLARARAGGYTAIAANVPAILRGEQAETDSLIARATAALADTGRAVIQSAEGPLSDAPAAGEALGIALGRVAAATVARTGIRRLLFAGGDTSSHGVAQLGIDALTWAAPIEAGAPLVRAHAADAAVDGLELVLKGGQMGSEDFVEVVRRGG